MGGRFGPDWEAILESGGATFPDDPPARQVIESGTGQAAFEGTVTGIRTIFDPAGIGAMAVEGITPVPESGLPGTSTQESAAAAGDFVADFDVPNIKTPDPGQWLKDLVILVAVVVALLGGVAIVSEDVLE